MRSFLSLLTVLFCAVTFNAQAQSLKDLLNKGTVKSAVENILSESGIIKTDITGSWTYSTGACVFESEDMLKQAGGALAANKISDKLGDLYALVGIKEGSFTYTFNADSTFCTNLSKKEIKGRYSISGSDLTLNYSMGKLLKPVTVNAKIQKTSDGISILFQADNMLKMFTSLCSSVQNKTIAGIGALASGYDGLLVGYTLKRSN